VSTSEYVAHSSDFTVAIIGGGFTGTTLAAQLLRADPTISVAVVERFSLPGRGIAYGTQYGLHLLNVPARNMSAFPHDPDHFLRWARSNYDAGAEGDDFLPRRIFGQYLAALLLDACSSHGQQLEWRQDEALSITRDGDRSEVRLRNGPKIVADKVVLALGNFRPSDPPLPGMPKQSTRYVPFAWAAGALEGVEKEGAVLLIGSGLTSVDLSLALRAHEFRGTIHIISRRGVIPEWHKPTQPWPHFWNEASPRTVRGLLRLVREQVQLAIQQGSDWRAVIDSLRPDTPKIWQSLPAAEKRRFLRHVRPYWEVHRHRVSSKIAGLMMYQVLNDDMQIHTGRVTRCEELPDLVEVTYRDRRTGHEQKIQVDRIINCTGSETDCRRLDDPLITNLRTQGLARPDPLFLGLDVAEDGALLNSDGMPSDFLYTVGPSRKGLLWETTAVPEIRVQVANLSQHLLDGAKHGPEAAVDIHSNALPASQ
jgi:uncharacterized NAD(P)/FAD-binding protein YdhS